ncbi:L1 cell adhesion molecule S homeolog isoform X3 [Xenopus laevis]|uniref:Neural cell adhesion molecule L1 n=1 Tax=Xenopus laevis TaxID=8355 RepID=A0A8J0TM89_XENLA|nr:L1 cell adhesion molecule S homeolog isoform X3 [Xenopus laevis]
MALRWGPCLLGTVLVSLLCSHMEAFQMPKELMYPPTITEQSPAKYVVYPNDDIVLKCEAKRNAKVKYTWKKDGETFAPEDGPSVNRKKDSGSIIISNGNGNAMKDFQGKYRCYATNELGTAISHEIHVITESTPKWQKEMIRPIEVEEGSSLILPCNPPKSAVPPRVIWMNSSLLHITQDKRVSMGVNGNLYFSNVQKQDEHPDYICHAQFVGARTIVQKEAISIKVRPTNSVKFRRPEMMLPEGSMSTVLALRDQPLQLECIAEGLPTPEIEWIPLTGSTTNGHIQYDDFKKTLHIDKVQDDDDGDYQCTAKNTQGTATHTFTVVVESAPYWINKPMDGIYAPGEDIILHCEVGGKPKPKVTWKINGASLKDSDLYHNWKLSEGSLVLNNMQLNDTSVVQCEARNKHGNLLANAFVYVVELPPQILTKNDEQYSVVEKTNVSMDCKTFGAPMPKIQWDRDQEDNLLALDQFSFHTNGTLTITGVVKEHEGIYWCTASNNQGNVNISAYLDVRNATKIISPPTEQRARKGGKAIFQCTVEFDPKMSSKIIDWKKNGLEINEDPDNDKYFIEDYTLSISNVQEGDQGMYTCLARSELDSVEQTAELVVIDLPESPSDLELSNAQETSITLTWTPGNENNSPIEEFIIEFEEDSFEPGVWHELTRVDGDMVTTDLNLSPYVNYQFRVIAVNEVGPSNGSNPSDRYRTPPSAPTKNPEEVKGEGTVPENMKISWKPLKGIDWNGPDFKYLVKWRRLGKDDWREEVAESPPVIVTETSTFEPYEIIVQSVNDLGRASEPKPIIGHSGEDFPDISPENVGLEAMNESAIKVAWLPVQKQGLNGHLKGFMVYYISHSSRHRQTKELRVHGNTTHALITGLKPFSNYSVEVAIMNGKGPGDRSESRMIRTDEGVPSPPSFLHLERQSDTSLTLIWGPPETPNGILTGYEIYHQIVNKTHMGAKYFSETINDPTQQNWTLSNISSKDTYRFYLYATTSVGQSEAVMVEGSTMQEIEVPPVLNVSIETGDSVVTLNWMQLEGSSNAEIKVEIRNKSSEHLWHHYGSVNTTDSTFQLSGLLPGTPYFIRLMALNHTQHVEIWSKMVQTTGIAITKEQRGFATEGWFIGLISAIVLLLLILLILCFIKRSKGGKYSVKDKEDTQVDSEARPMKDETFGEYRSLESENDEKPFTSSQPSLNGDIKQLGSDDSLADYGGSVDVQFNEDGSFIGQYSGKKEKEPAGGNESSGATSPVNPNIANE